MDFTERISGARTGTNKTIICKVPSGWAALADMQYLRGYIIHMAHPMVASINGLDEKRRALFLKDMALIGDALIEVTDAYRVNYAIAGNKDPYLHAHIIPRYLDEPEQYRTSSPWSYPQDVMEGRPFDYERDRELMAQLAEAIQKRL